MRKTIIKITLSIISFIIFILVLSSCYTVKPNEYVALYQFGKIIYTTDNPGLKFRLPFIHSVKHISKQIHIYDIKPSDVITKDKKSMIADNYVLWKVTDPIKYVQTLNAIEINAMARIEAAVYNATKNIISSMTQEEIIKARGELLCELITKESNSDISDYGITIIDTQIKALDLPNDNKFAVYQRMISERQNIAAQFAAEGNSKALKIRNMTDRDIQIKLADAKKNADVIIAEGEAEYMKILANAYDTKEKEEFYSFIRSLDALKAGLKNNNKTIILNKESPIVNLLYK